MVVAMVALALTCVAITGLLILRAVDDELAEFAHRDLELSAMTAAEVGEEEYSEAGGWTQGALYALEAVERARGHVILVFGTDGRPIAGSPDDSARGGVRAAVHVGGRRVGTVIATRREGSGVDGAAGALDSGFRRQVNHVLARAGLVAGTLAVVLALLIALRMARPLRRLTQAARRMQTGDIEARAAGSGGALEITTLARTLDRLAVVLRRQDDLRRATAADVTHELRGALVGLLGRVEVLRDRPGDDPEAVLLQMQEDGYRLRRLVDDVYRLAEAQQPGLLVQKRPMNLDEVAARCVSAFAERFRASAITLSQRLDEATVDGDPERLWEVVQNLLSNALRYTDAGGRVVVRLTARDGHAVLEVVDSGIGVRPEQLDRIFDRFWRAPEAAQRVPEGSGVGLALVQEITAAHDGSVDVVSRPGQGSTFRIRVPLCDEPAPRGVLPRELGPDVATAEELGRELVDEAARGTSSVS
jgi:two-component system sensor histidine kinase BaeS